MAHVAKAVIWRRSDKKVLMQLRPDGTWSSFGGKLNEGESPIEALIRELGEELKYKLKAIPHFMWTFTTQKEGNTVHSYNFVEEYDGQPLIFNEEGQGSWFTLEEALELPMSCNRRLTLKKAGEWINKCCDTARP
ncbi:NUDIX domain-containing protein [Candidatus Parcubacteria bacterium]|nr:NUDIX domain-containing protein [Candidatus Parcubacteria bacterium]